MEELSEHSQNSVVDVVRSHLAGHFGSSAQVDVTTQVTHGTLLVELDFIAYPAIPGGISLEKANFAFADGISGAQVARGYPVVETVVRVHGREAARARVVPAEPALSS